MKVTPPSMRVILFFVMVASAGIGTGAAQEGPAVCGSLENNGVGPWDYRGSTYVTNVEKFHFTPSVENLRKGATTMTPGGDISYMLTAFPNHHRALMAMVRFARKTKKNPPPEMTYSVECWFERAERFKADDAMVKTIHGIYLLGVGKTKEGVRRLEEASEMAGNNGNISYNLGLAYFDLEEYDRALEHAHRAYALGFALPGLKSKLQRAGKWREATSAAVNPPEHSNSSRTDKKSIEAVRGKE